jgi:hypothetical protein
MVVDLFEPSIPCRFALKAAELKKSMSLEKIGKALGISKRQAHLAAQLGLKMIAQGITDPYRRLTAAPTCASRWRGSRRRPGEGASNPDRREESTDGDTNAA